MMTTGLYILTDSDIYAEIPDHKTEAGMCFIGHLFIYPLNIYFGFAEIKPRDVFFREPAEL